MPTLPRYTVIIAVPFFSSEWGSLNSLFENSPPQETQILIAVGRHPSRQRNAALDVAQGEIIVFLDSDSVPDEDYWKQLDAAFESKKVEVVGGPALLRRDATFWEKVFHLQLSHALVVGPVAARYESFGVFRPSSQLELILCNMAVRRSVFDTVGRFSPELFPNEENEWLDRAVDRAVYIYHDPKMTIRRGQHEKIGDFLGMIFRNGRGRTHQSLLSRKVTAQQYVLLAAALLLLIMALDRGLEVFTAIAVLWAGMSLFVFLGSDRVHGWAVRFWASLLAPLVPMSYALGQVAGFFQSGPGRADAPIEVFNEVGEPVLKIPPAQAR